MNPRQLPLFSTNTQTFNFPFPSTRYQGSKRKLIDWIWENVSELTFETVLDVFGGTGAVSHMFKNAAKTVTYNDNLAFNHNIGLALIENAGQKLSQEEIELVLGFQESTNYPDFIQRNFSGIYFTDEENVWLDHVIHNIDHLLENPYKKALARFALFQACIIKRPYNLFHRANLYMRTANVDRSFGNKTTWDTAFETHFCNFIAEANNAVFDNTKKNTAIEYDALDTPTGFDLVYIDPPYLNKNGIGVDYRDFYHFLEGVVSYETWGEKIDYKSKHHRLKPQKSNWNNPSKIIEVFEALIRRHRNSILVVSYRDDGIPTKNHLLQLLLKYKKTVYEAVQPMQYALAHKQTHELLLIAE
jgi:adenine-specific DNA-methyltransferase